MKEIGRVWRLYHQVVLVPAGAPPVQVEETRRAFFAGAIAVLEVVGRISSDDSIDVEKGIEMLEGMTEEVQDYIRKFKMKHGIVEKQS